MLLNHELLQYCRQVRGAHEVNGFKGCFSHILDPEEDLCLSK